MVLGRPLRGQLTHRLLSIIIYLIASLVVFISGPSYQQSNSVVLLESEPFYIDLEHKLGSSAQFKPRGSILIRPRTDYRPAQASFVQHNELTKADLGLLKDASLKNDLYFLRTICRRNKENKNEESSRATQTIIKCCSLQAANLVDFITVNLNSVNGFLNINLHTADQDCANQYPDNLSVKFNTTITIASASVGPQPDTGTYIKRLEEERQSKLKEGKEDNRSFLAKYWIYIVPGVIILMMLGGPEQGAR